MIPRICDIRVATYCMRHSWLTKLEVLCLNQLVAEKVCKDTGGSQEEILSMEVEENVEIGSESRNTVRDMR